MNVHTGEQKPSLRDEIWWIILVVSVKSQYRTRQDAVADPGSWSGC